MAPSKTIATLRVPCDLRDEIARIAELRGTTMLAVLTEAVYRLGRDEWWSSVRDALDGLSPSEVVTYQSELRQMGSASPDGLDERLDPVSRLAIDEILRNALGR